MLKLSILGAVAALVVALAVPTASAVPPDRFVFVDDVTFQSGFLSDLCETPVFISFNGTLHDERERTTPHVPAKKTASLPSAPATLVPRTNYIRHRIVDAMRSASLAWGAMVRPDAEEGTPNKCAMPSAPHDPDRRRPASREVCALRTSWTSNV
jgi:hypothetical protein